MANYNLSETKIAVDPPALQAQATSIGTCRDSMVTHINNVVTCWQNLALTWNGTTAEEAEDFNNRWKSTMTHLFGDGGENKGIIGQIGQVVLDAAGNYAHAESTITKSFTDFTAALGSTDSNSGGQEDSLLPPITIDY